MDDTNGNKGRVSITQDSPLLKRLQNISHDDRRAISRMLSGDADNDRVRRGDVLQIVRDLRTDPVKSVEYQKALGDVTKKLGRLPPSNKPEDVAADIERDAARWRALMSSERIRLIGRFGFMSNPETKVTMVDTEAAKESCLHMGIEIWDRYAGYDVSLETRGTAGWDTLTAYADYLISKGK